MAVLTSEDKECGSTLGLIAGERVELQDQTWQRFVLNLKTGDRELSLGNEKESADACMFCRQPEDEIGAFIRQLDDLLEGKRDNVRFEPTEPSFELEIARSAPNSLYSGLHRGLKVHVWIDSGNAKSGIYRWDALGIRFFTLEQHLASFVEQLRQEFAC